MAKKAAANESVGSFLKRSVAGTTFLALEHAMHVVFLIVISGLITAALLIGIQMWADPAAANLAFGSLSGAVMAGSALMVAAALIVLGPFLVILEKRTRAERTKRPGFERRIAYKAPLYVGLAVVWVIKLAAIITLVSMGLYLLASLNHLNYDSLTLLYQRQFIPAFVTLIVFGVTGWYLIRLAQGKDYSQKFNVALCILTVLLAVGLFATATVMLQNPDAFDASQLHSYGQDGLLGPNLFKYY